MLLPPFRIGVDIGGTFTDLVIVDARGSVRAFKAPSVPSDPAEGVVAAVGLAADYLQRSVESLLGDTELFVHGSTVATNTLLERKGGRVGLLTTRGFRDTLEIRRGLREDVWDHRTPPPEVLVPRYLRLPVDERTTSDGRVGRPVDPATVRDAVAVFRAEGVDAVAVSLLHAYKNPANERRVRALLEEFMPGTWVTCSSEVAPVIGEYERTSTTVTNAYVAGRVVPYLHALNRRLVDLGLRQEMLVIQSNGGAISVGELDRKPVELILSGPAAAVGSMRFFGHDTGSANLVSIEVGGTSCDVMLLQDGVVGMTDQLVVDGQHLVIPAVEIHTVGAGGGTIASTDTAGFLRAGPEGAGARPGPAAYGYGGERPTVTDAQLVLGRLKPGPYAGGAISLDLDKAVEAISKHVAVPLGVSVHDAAAGIIRIVEQNMQHAVERVSVERGYNPKHFTMVAAGGAGPLHGSPIARALGCEGLYIPRLAGVFCAFGMCNADIRHDYQRSWLRDLDDSDPAAIPALDAAFAEMVAEARGVLSREGFSGDKAGFQRGYDLRYFGQQWTVFVDVQSSDTAAIRQAFEVAYRRLYGYVQPQGQIQIVNLRLSGAGKLPPLLSEAPEPTTDAPVAVARRQVWLDPVSGFRETDIYDGAVLRPGQTLSGPAIIEEQTTTILVGAGDQLRVTEANNYLVRPLGSPEKAFAAPTPDRIAPPVASPDMCQA